MRVLLYIFRFGLLITLIFRLLFLKHLSYEVEVFSYIILAIMLIGFAILEILCYLEKRRRLK